MTESIHIFWNRIGKRKRYWLPVIFFTISTFGYSVFSRTISVDDLATDYYFGSGHQMISAGRWGMNLLIRLSAIPLRSPASDRLLATAFLVLAGILLSAMFFSIHDIHSGTLYVEKYTVLTCALITYPIIGEIWEYTGANYFSTLGMLISVCTCYYLLSREKTKIKDLLLAGVGMALPMSSYESGVLFYITLICTVLFYCFFIQKLKRMIEYWKKAVILSAPLFVAVSIRWGVACFLRWIYGVEKGTVGETGIYWNKEALLATFKKLIIDTELNYFINGLVYLPITVFILSIILLMYCIVLQSIYNRSFTICFSGVVMILSAFTISVIQGAMMQYRVATPLSILASFSFFCIMTFIEHKAMWKKRLCMIILFYLIWIQSAFLNSELALNNQRSDNEMRLMSMVAQDVLSLDANKPVIFVGENNPSEYFLNAKKGYSDTAVGHLYERIIDHFRNKYGFFYDYYYCHLTEFPVTNVTPMINPLLSSGKQTEEYLSYLGYDIQVVDRRTHPEALKEAQEFVERTHMHSYDVMEMGEFVIATLQLYE